MPCLPLDMSTNVGKKCGLLIKQTQTARHLPSLQKKLIWIMIYRHYANKTSNQNITEGNEVYILSY